jgi:hypothetical protein
MRIRLIVCGLSLVCSLPAFAQDDGAADLSNRKVTVMAGIGNIFAGFGSTIEVYPFHKQVGLVGGIGYVPDSDNGVSGAGALRLSTGGDRHRLFLEGSFGPVAVSVGNFSQSTHYGFGGAVGYSYTARRGFTVLISGGLGRTTSVADTEALLSFGMGYTWH